MENQFPAKTISSTSVQGNMVANALFYELLKKPLFDFPYIKES